MVEDIVIAKEGRIGVCIDICLEMSGGMQTPDQNDDKEGVGNHETKSGLLESGEHKSKGPSTQTSDLLGLEGDAGFNNLSLGDDGNRNKMHGEQINLMD